MLKETLGQIGGRRTIGGTPGRELHIPLPNTKHSLQNME